MSISSIPSSITGYLITAAIGVANSPVIQSVYQIQSKKLVESWVCVPFETDSIPCFPKMAGRTPFCADRFDLLHSFQPALKKIADIINFPVDKSYELLGWDQMSSMPYTLIPYSVAEELFCRGLIQNGLLRALPKKAIERVFPGQGSKITDHPIARITRCAVTAGLFALLHTRKWECGDGGTLPEFVAGMIFGAVGEYSVTHACFAHVISNLTLYALGARMSSVAME